MGRPDDEVEALVTHCREVLGQPETWLSPSGYPGSLALCVLDAIWSIGVRYRGVVNVVAAYRRCRAADGADADRDDLTELADVIARVGGAEPFATL